MAQAGFRISLAWFGCLYALGAQAQSTQEIVTDVVLQAAEAWDDSRAAREARREEQARRQQQKEAEKHAYEEAARRRHEDFLKSEELRRKKEVDAIRNWPGVGALTPPLEPGEAFAVTENGCGIIHFLGNEKLVAAARYTADGKVAVDADGRALLEKVPLQTWMSTVTWSGDCRNGMAHGLGALARRSELPKLIDMKFEYAFGRPLSRSLFPDSTQTSREIHYKTADKLHVSIPAWREPFKPRFGDSLQAVAHTRISLADMSQGYQSTAVEAEIDDCMGLKKKPRGCSYENNYGAYVVKTIVYANGTSQITETPCPDPGTDQGCEAVWQKVAGPLIAKIQPLIAQVEDKDKTRRAQLESLNSMYELNARVAQMARAAEEEQDIQRRKIAQQQGEIEAKRKQAEAEAAGKAEQEKAEKEFKARLASLNAGQLYVMADELRVAGKLAQARDALRAIIARFPDHALAASAASALSTLK